MKRLLAHGIAIMTIGISSLVCLPHHSQAYSVIVGPVSVVADSAGTELAPDAVEPPVLLGFADETGDMGAVAIGRVFRCRLVGAPGYPRVWISGSLPPLSAFVLPIHLCAGQTVWVCLYGSGPVPLALDVRRVDSNAQLVYTGRGHRVEIAFTPVRSAPYLIVVLAGPGGMANPYTLIVHGRIGAVPVGAKGKASVADPI